jgi:hypothetical protein
VRQHARSADCRRLNCIGEPGDALDGVIGNHHSKFGTIDVRNKPCGTGQPGRIDKRPRLKERGFLRERLRHQRGHSRLEKVFDRQGNSPGEVRHRSGDDRMIAARRLLIQLTHTPRGELRDAGSHQAFF